MPQNFNLIPTGAAVSVTSEHEFCGHWPEISPGNILAGPTTPINPAHLMVLRNKPPFGGPARYYQGQRGAPHVGTRAYGANDPNISTTACWNWALTGCTISSPRNDLWVRPDHLIAMNAETRQNDLGLPVLTRQQYLNHHDTTDGLRLCYQLNQHAINTWLGMGQATEPQIRMKMTAFARLMCAIKGLTIVTPVAVANARYWICCAYDANQVNWDHWGISIVVLANQQQSLQKVPDTGIWKSGSFVADWGPPHALPVRASAKSAGRSIGCAARRRRDRQSAQASRSFAAWSFSYPRRRFWRPTTSCSTATICGALRASSAR